MKGRGKEIEERICVERFLNWYNKRHKGNYTYEKAAARFPGLKGSQDWDFFVYEPDNLEEWIGIEVKELQFLRETSIRLSFWQRLCSDLTGHLQSKRIQGRFEISLPPILGLTQNERQGLLDAFCQVLIDKQSDWEVRETKDIGPDIATKFPNWPTQPSDVDEWDHWERDRPSKIEIRRASDSGCDVRAVTSPLIVGDVPEEEKKAFNEVFRLKNGVIWPDRQLKLAKEMGARKTILLLAGIGVDEGLTRNSVQNLNNCLISHIDCIYLVDVGQEDRVAKIYPS